ncbi:MAG: P-II family nitrogen regulator [Nitrospirae bacterium]|nr:P-II family nitrogen regulator [Nitrospirota bacterium]
MKRIEAIISPTKVDQVCAILENVGYPSVTISNVEGRGSKKGSERKIRGITYTVPFVEEKRVVLVVKDKEVDGIMKAIREAACTGKTGDGMIFVSSMDNAMSIRTGETGETAV